MTLMALLIDVWPTGTTSTSHELTGGCGEGQEIKEKEPIKIRHTYKEPIREIRQKNRCTTLTGSSMAATAMQILSRATLAPTAEAM